MKDKDIKIGFEIECILHGSGNIQKEEIGEYHEGNIISGYFEVQSDSSLNGDGYFDYELTAEFVSKVLESKEDFFNAVKDFRRLIEIKGTELKGCCYFNKSCGCHIHFSQGKSNFKSFIPHKYLIQMRNLFFKELEKSPIIQKTTKEKIKSHYFRRYAIKSTKQAYLNSYVRNTEFNSISEENGCGLEWRSFNLCGVSTWLEFEEMFRIAWVCLEYIFNIKIKGYKTREPINLNKKLKEVIIEEEKKAISQIKSVTNEIKLYTKGVYLVSPEKKINVPIFSSNILKRSTND